MGKPNNRILYVVLVVLTLFFLCFGLLFLCIVYYLFVYTLPIQDIKELFSIQWYYFIWLFLPIISNLLYFHVLRKYMLEKHRLYKISGRQVYSSGLKLLVINGIFSLFIAAVLFIAGLLNYNIDKTIPFAFMVSVVILVSIFSVNLSVWITHTIDYHLVCDYLINIPSLGLSPGVVRTLDVRKHIEDKCKPKGPTDRDISKSLIDEHLTILKTHLDTFQNDKDSDSVINLVKEYGNIAALIHSDYLPIHSHLYLKISQLRGLNMPPRRVQLLGRKWTLRGLESEYVIVHDISEIRSEYQEYIEDNPQMNRVNSEVRNLEGELKNLIESSDIPKKPKDELTSVMIDSIKGRSQLEKYREPKWRQRSLKKRVLVVVRPDATLMEITIEEERQFNI